MAGKRVLFIDSYAEDYPWSADVLRAAKAVFAPTEVDLRVVHMDTKAHPEEDFKVLKATEIKGVIDSYSPDVVVACDDNAAKYVVTKYLRNGPMPVVFCGINYDASKYDFPTSSITGIVEVDPYPQMAAILQAVGVRSPRIAAICPDNESDRANLEGGIVGFGLNLTSAAYVSTFSEWKEAYAALQDQADVIILYNNAGLKGWNDGQAVDFVEAKGRTLTMSFVSWMAPFTAVTYSRTGGEQGRWAAEAALRILGGVKPADIPVARNRQDILIVNRRLAGRSRVAVPQAIFDAAAKVID